MEAFGKTDYLPPTMMKRTFLIRRPLMAAVVAAGLLVSVNASAHGLNCVQFVQQASRLPLHGDAWQWWDAAAADQLGRGSAPKPGSVMVFSKTHLLQHGHVALVRAVKNSRSILVDHANWSPIQGHRGQIERSVEVVDVSPNNDWSRVRVWYHPTGEIGQTVYPVKGFVYPGRTLPHHGH